jgi:hypothetical protein
VGDRSLKIVAERDAGVITASRDDVCVAAVTPTRVESERMVQIARATPTVAEARHPATRRL